MTQQRIARRTLGLSDVLSAPAGWASRFGLNPAVGASYEAVWDYGGDYNFVVAAGPKVSSSDANDTAAGTGARTVRVFGLVAGVETSEDVTLNGQTQVALTKVFTSVYSCEVLTAGSGGTNAGDIYCSTGAVTAGVPNTATTVHFKMLAGASMSYNCAFRVPAGFTAYVLAWWASQAEVASGFEAQLCTRDPATGVTKAHSDQVGIEQKVGDEFRVPIEVPAGEDIFVRAKTLGVGTPAMSARIEIALCRA